MALPLFFTLVLAVQAPAAAPGASITVSDVSVACVSQGSHPRIDARITPALSVADASVQFRSATAKGWYSISLRQREGDLFSAHLPRPKWLHEFEFFVRATDPAGNELASPVQRALVGKAADCAVDGRKIVVKDLLVRRPDGADGDNDALPPGFSRRGTAGDIGMFELSGKAIAGITAVAVGGIATTAAVLAQGENPSNPIPDRPAIEYNLVLVNTIPPAGSTLHVGDTYTLAFEVRQQSSFDYVGPRASALRIDLYPAGQNTSCSPGVIFQPGPSGFPFATVVVASGTVQPFASCATPATIDRAVVTFLQADLTPFTAVQLREIPLRYTIVP